MPAIHPATAAWLGTLRVRTLPAAAAPVLVGAAYAHHVGGFDLLPALAALVGALPDWNGEIPHPTPRRQFMCTLTGAYEVTASDGAVREFGPGKLLLLEDTHGKGHTTRAPAGCVVIAIALD